MTSVGFYDFQSAWIIASLPQVTKVSNFGNVPDVKVFNTYSGWILGQKDRKTGTLKLFPARVMARLQVAESLELNLHFKQDYRQAWICASFAHKGRPEPFLESSYAVYGCHPDKVFPRWLEEQKARLGREFYLFYDDEGVLRPDIPKFSPTTAHRANGASLPELTAGPVPFPRKEIV